MKFIKAEKLTNERFLNLFKLYFESENGEIIEWIISSRAKDINNLTCITGETKADTICIIPKIKIDNKEHLVITKEFRQPVNDYIYSFPAGAIEKGEKPLEGAIREAKEEIGAEEISEINQLTDICYNSEGMTDESVIIYEVVVTKLGKQNLQDHEDIKLCIVPIEELADFVNDKTKKFSTKTAIYCPMLIREFELKKQYESLLTTHILNNN